MDDKRIDNFLLSKIPAAGLVLTLPGADAEAPLATAQLFRFHYDVVHKMVHGRHRSGDGRHYCHRRRDRHGRQCGWLLCIRTVDLLFERALRDPFDHRLCKAPSPTSLRAGPEYFAGLVGCSLDSRGDLGVSPTRSERLQQIAIGCISPAADVFNDPAHAAHAWKMNFDERVYLSKRRCYKTERNTDEPAA